MVCKIAATIIKEDLREHFVFSPICHSHTIALVGDLPGSFDYWREYNRWFLERCDEVWVVMLPGWDKSVGVNAEIKMATLLGKPVKYLQALDHLGD